MPTSSSRPGKGSRSGGCGLWFVAAALVLLTVAGYLAYHVVEKSPEGAGCTVRVGGDSVDLAPDEAADAATIAAVASARALPERALAIALATALQESRLRNLDHGDRDSLGLFQQRPSQGWGTPRQIQDPVYATNAFFDGLVKIPDYLHLPLTVAAQRVQKSGYPEAYAKHEADATLLAAGLAGRKRDALTCRTGADSPDSAGGGPGDTGKVKALLTREFGNRVRPRADGAPRTVAVPPSDSGRGVGGAPAADRGWALAQWAVAHAHGLKIEQVSFGDLRWQAARSDKGWQKVPSPSAGTGRTKPVAAASSDGVVRISVAQ